MQDFIQARSRQVLHINMAPVNTLKTIQDTHTHIESPLKLLFLFSD